MVDEGQLTDSINQQLLYLLDIRSISHSHLKNVKLKTVILCHVLIVLGEELRIRERNDRAVDSLQQR